MSDARIGPPPPRVVLVGEHDETLARYAESLERTFEVECKDIEGFRSTGPVDDVDVVLLDLRAEDMHDLAQEVVQRITGNGNCTRIGAFTSEDVIGGEEADAPIPLLPQSIEPTRLRRVVTCLAIRARLKRDIDDLADLATRLSQGEVGDSDASAGRPLKDDKSRERTARLTRRIRDQQASLANLDCLDGVYADIVPDGTRKPFLEILRNG